MPSPSCPPALCSRRLALAADVETEAGLREAVGNPASTPGPPQAVRSGELSAASEESPPTTRFPCKGRTS